MEVTNEIIMKYLKVEGVVHAGIATPETLEGGPPSTDLSYVMPSAKSSDCVRLAFKSGCHPGLPGEKRPANL